MTANKKPDLRDSLTKVLSPRRKNTASDVEQDNKNQSKNVSPIDSIPVKVNVNKDATPDPFMQAENEYADEVISVVNDSQEPIPTETEPEPVAIKTNKVSDIKPEKVSKSKLENINPKRAKQTSTQKGSSKLLSGTAIVLSLIAIAGSSYSILSQSGIKEKLAEGIAAVESSIADLTDRTDLFQSSIASVKQSVSDNSFDIAKLQGLQGDVLQLHEAINVIRSEADQVNNIIQAHKTTLGEHDKLITDLEGNVKKLSIRPKTVVKKTTVKPKPKPVVTNTNSIDGATLSTIDRWGSSSYVVLRDEAGKWVPLQRGDLYKGWRYSGTTGDEALFKKGSETKKLTVES